MEKPRKITPRKLAEQWGVSVDAILRLIKSGLLPAFDISRPSSQRRRYIIDEAEAQAYLEGRRVTPPPRSRPRRSSLPPIERLV